MVYAVSSRAAVLLISRFTTCDRIVAVFAKLKFYIVMQGAESSNVVSIMLKLQASLVSRNRVPACLRFHGHYDRFGMLTTPGFLFCPCRRRDSAVDCFFGQEDLHGSSPKSCSPRWCPLKGPCRYKGTPQRWHILKLIYTLEVLHEIVIFSYCLILQF